MLDLYKVSHTNIADGTNSYVDFEGFSVAFTSRIQEARNKRITNPEVCPQITAKRDLLVGKITRLLTHADNDTLLEIYLRLQQESD